MCVLYYSTQSIKYKFFPDKLLWMLRIGLRINIQPAIFIIYAKYIPIPRSGFKLNKVK